MAINLIFLASIFFIHLTAAFSGDYFYHESGRKIQLRPIDQKNSSLKKSTLLPFPTTFTTIKGNILEISNELFIEFNQALTSEQLNDFEKKNAINLLKKINLNKRQLYLYETQAQKDPLSLANTIMDDPIIKNARPNFKRVVNKRHQIPKLPF